MIVGWFGTTAGISAISTGSSIVNLVIFTVARLAMGITVMIGLAAPTATIFGIAINVVFYIIYNQKIKKAQNANLTIE